MNKENWISVNGYAYKWEHTFGATHQKINRDSTIDEQVKQSHIRPLPVYTELTADLARYPRLDKAVGHATLKTDNTGIYAHISLYPTSCFQDMTEQYIKENCNIGLSVLGTMSFFSDEGLQGVQITALQFGRFLAPHVYTPNTVSIGSKKSWSNM